MKFEIFLKISVTEVALMRWLISFLQLMFHEAALILERLCCLPPHQRPQRRRSLDWASQKQTRFLFVLSGDLSVVFIKASDNERREAAMFGGVEVVEARKRSF